MPTASRWCPIEESSLLATVTGAWLVPQYPERPDNHCLDRLARRATNIGNALNTHSSLELDAMKEYSSCNLIKRQSLEIRDASIDRKGLQ